MIHQQRKTVLLSILWAMITVLVLSVTWFSTPLIIEMSKPRREVAQDPTGWIKIDKNLLNDIPDFSEMRCNRQRTGYMPSKPGIRIDSIVWRKKTMDPYTSWFDNPGTSAPCVITPDLVISPGKKGEVVALDIINGDIKWKTETLDKDGNKYLERLGALSANQDYVFVSSLEESKYIWILSRLTGKILWSTKLPAGCSSPSILVKEAMIIHGSDGYIEGYNENKKNWLFSTGSDTVYPMTIVPKTNNGILLNSDGRIYRINLTNGQVLWISNLANDSGSATVIQDNLAYVTDHGGFLSALNIKDGTLEWRVDVDKLPLDSPASDGQTIIVSGRFGSLCKVIALEKKTGKIVWKTELKNMIEYFDPYIIGNQVLTACSDHKIHLASKKAELVLLNIKTGKETQRFQLHNVPGQMITISNGHIWVNTIQGYTMKVAYK